ncbi:hypothetical protein [Ligilactobacillus hayakitensis]|uniref:hypothetical protein n=1 Tax=Ligilactobacillus hayakitensis TaxID=396716 RepID=UPI000469505D|nr:hypothetical protein [Ligilactobacillus hayakitensis]
MLISDFLDATVGMDETFILTQKNDEQLVFSGKIIEITSEKIIIGPAQHEIHLGTLIYKLKNLLQICSYTFKKSNTLL